MLFYDASKLMINNKEVESIKTIDGAVLYQKEQQLPYALIVTFTGKTLTRSLPSGSAAFIGNNVIIDYGDGTVVMSGGSFGHTYAEQGTYTIKIYNVTGVGSAFATMDSGLMSIILPNTITSLGGSAFNSCHSLESIILPNSVTSMAENCFTNCSRLTSISLPQSLKTIGESGLSQCRNLTSITIPKSVTSLGGGCFSDCSKLTSINLEWETSDKILPYQSSWIRYINTDLKFYIPTGTTQLYVDKGYPASMLVEHAVLSLALTSNKQILSYYDNDSATLTATLTEGGVPVEGETVYFYTVEGGVSNLLGTGVTDSNGECSVSYNSKGAGDLNIKVECMNLQETYEVEDTLLYRSSVSNSDIFDVSLPNKFRISSIVNRTSETNSYCYYEIYNGSSLVFDVGVLREKGSLSVRNGSTLVADNNTSIIPLNTNAELVYDYNNGNHSLTCNKVTVTGTDSSSITAFKNIHIERYNLSELKIKPL